MKGLLLKDWYMIAKYNRIFLLMLLVISAMLYFDGNTCFFAIYLCVLTGTLPVSALSYDDREKWCAYCQTMPVTRAEYVGGKYILGCLFAAAAVALSALPLLVRGAAASELAGLLPILPLLALAPSAVCLPLFFRFGAEKGRMAYLIVIVVLCVGGNTVNQAGLDSLTASGGFGLAALAAAAVLYGLSWLLSVRFFEKKEL